MRILVTGGAGFIGTHLVRLLVRKGHEVLNVDKLTYAGNAASLSDPVGLPNHHFLQADICDAAAMHEAFQTFRPDAVMHLAAESHVDRSIDAPRAFIETNVIGTYTLLQAARGFWSRELKGADLRTSNKRFLHVSTDEVFGSLGEEGAFTETTPYAPRSPYSASKAASDHFARAWANTYGLPVLVTHSSNNYGPRQFPEKFIPVVILKALRGEPIPVYGDGGNIRDWLHVEDHAEALLAVLLHGKTGETYNIGGNNERRNIDLAHLLCRILDELCPREDGTSHASLITFTTDRPGHDARYALDAAKIKNDLGWTPQHDPESGFRKTVQWYLDNEDWWQSILRGSHRLERLGNGES